MRTNLHESEKARSRLSLPPPFSYHSWFMASSSPVRPDSRWKLLLIGCGLAGLAFNLLLALANSRTWDVDFNQYYAAGKLVGSGRLYDWDSIRPLELERNAKAVPFGRIPAFALAFKPLSALPYPVARLLWLSAGMAALAGFVCLWPFSSRAWVWVVLCWSAPAAMCLAYGQDSVLFLFFVALGLRLLLGGHDFCAGLAFSVCAAKPHLALLIPVFLAARLKWRSLLGGVAGGAIILALSFAAEGKDWPHRLLTLAQTPEFDPAAGRMPNLRGLLSFTGGGLAAEAALGLAVVAAVWFLSRKQPLWAVGALVPAGGLLLSHHAYFYDALLLLPVLLLPYRVPAPEWMRRWALVLFTPLPYLLLLTNAGVLGHLAISGYTLAAIAVAVWRGRGRSVRP
jgi:alpha-1,2-mannosyltransferase